MSPTRSPARVGQDNFATLAGLFPRESAYYRPFTGLTGRTVLRHPAA